MSGSGQGMFDPLTDSEQGSAAVTNTRLDAGKGEEPARAVPVPSDAPEPDWSVLSGYGQPSKVWDYRDAEGQCSFLVAQWEMPGSGNGAKPGKVIRPVAWNGANWTLKAMSEDRPLYRLPELLGADPETQVIVVEGEKCADAVVKAFPGKVVTTWEGGAQAWRKTDFSPLPCARVLLVADADDPGRMAMRDLGAHLLKHGARVRILQPPGDDGADIADKIEQGGATQASAWLKALAEDCKPGEHEDAPKGEASRDDDWQSNLLSRAKTEPGALFEDDTIKKLVALRNGNLSAWINLRSGGGIFAVFGFG